jgi:hypothetical protein
MCSFILTVHYKNKEVHVEISGTLISPLSVLCTQPQRWGISFIALSFNNLAMGWWSGSSSKNICLASMRPRVQTPVPRKKGKRSPAKVL